MSSSVCIEVDTVSTAELQRAVRRLKPYSAAGPDEIPPFLVKDCISVLEQPLLYIYNLSLEMSKYPLQWKTSRVTPIPKTGAKNDITMFRPIAVLSALGKVFESIIDNRIRQQLNVWIPDEQHGFRASRSTATSHINFVDYVTIEMDAGRQVDAAYFDFRKAFDVVDNDILLSKMASIGFTPKLLSFFASYLSDRTQYVRLGRFESDSYYTRSGVSQGTTLGPTQFIIMAIDLPETVRAAKCLLFADDLKLYLAVSDLDDCQRLQADIDAVEEWSEVNRLYFNVGKCKVMTFSRSRTPLYFDYSLAGTLLDRVNQIRDLGLILDSRLNFRDHIIAACESANRMLGFVMRVSYAFKGIRAALTLYKAYVRSRLEFNAIVWDPHEAKYAFIIERIQKKFARFIFKRMYGYYPYLYPSLFVGGMVGLDTLELRRKLLLLVHYHRLLTNKVDNPTTLERVGLAGVPSRFLVGGEGVVGPRRRRKLFALPPGVRTRRAAAAPTARAVTLLNSLLTQHMDLDIFCDKPYLICKFVYLFLCSILS